MKNQMDKSKTKRMLGYIGDMLYKDLRNLPYLSCNYEEPSLSLSIYIYTYIYIMYTVHIKGTCIEKVRDPTFEKFSHVLSKFGLLLVQRKPRPRTGASLYGFERHLRSNDDIEHNAS